MKFGTGKQAQAITVNQKEDRILEKTDTTLKLEREYAMKLIELSSREVKIHQRRLKTKVGKIKSHLSVEEIKEFREQENEHRFGPTINTVAVSGAFTIAAAERRLKLSKERRLAAHGCLPDGTKAMTTRQYQRQQCDRLCKTVPVRSRHSSQYTDTPPATPATPVTPGPSSVRLSFHFRDAESTLGADESLSTITETPKTPKSARSAPGVGSTTQRDVTDGRIKVALKARPATSVGPRREMVTHPPRCKSSSGYSSHAAIEKDARDRERIESGRGITRKQSLLSNSSIDGDLAKGRLEERRQTMLDLEQMQTLRLIDRKQDFLNRVNKWVNENPSTNKEVPQMSKLMSVLGSDPAAGAGAGRRGSKGADKADKRKKTVTRNSSFHGNAKHNQRQDKPVEVHWKDLNKCRYLRISEDEIDLSGVVTLAKDQLKMYAALRQTDNDTGEN